MKNEQKKKSSGIPLGIIVLVLIIAVVGAAWYYNSVKPSASRNANRAANAANTSRPSQTAATAPPGAQPPNMLGSPTAAVTVEEFADFQCGACASVHPAMKELQSIYGSKIKFIFRNYPLSIPAHDKAYNAAVAVEAAGLQDRNKFWAMQNLLFTNQQEWTQNPNYRELWADYAQKIGLDVERFKNDMAGTMAKSRVDLDLQRGRGVSVDSTPTLLVNGKAIPLQAMTVASLRPIIDAEIQSAGSRSQSSTSNTNTGSAPVNSANANGNVK